MRARLRIEKPNANALRKNPSERPTRAMRRPATDGPTIRAPLNDTELSPTALVRCSRPTSSITSDWRAGWSIEAMMPHSTATTATCQNFACPLKASIPSAKARQACVLCVTNRSVRRLTRSASTPVKTDRSSTGPNCSVEVRPSRNGEWVSCSTSHDWVTVCIHVPVWPTSVPAK
jgi:hypothetical protein